MSFKFLTEPKINCWQITLPRCLPETRVRIMTELSLNQTYAVILQIVLNPFLDTVLTHERRHLIMGEVDRMFEGRVHYLWTNETN